MYRSVPQHLPALSPEPSATATSTTAQTLKDGGHGGADGALAADAWIHDSPRQLAQRRRIESVFGRSQGRAASLTPPVQRVKGLLRGQHVLVGADRHPGIVLNIVGLAGQETGYSIYIKGTRSIADESEADVEIDPVVGDMTADQAEADALLATGGGAQPSALPVVPSPVQVQAMAQLGAASGVAVHVSANVTPLVTAVPDPPRVARAKAYLGALQHIRLVPIYEKSFATDTSGMGHLSAARQSVDNLLLLGFKGTIEVVYSNNGFNEDAMRDLFPAFPQGAPCRALPPVHELRTSRRTQPVPRPVCARWPSCPASNRTTRTRRNSASVRSR